MDYIKVRGAREHNLKNVDLDIPKNRIVVFTGVSGSGKSSLAFDTIYAEGQRRYVESLGTYARQFLGIMGKPDVDLIEGLSPAISIDQKTTSHNPRSTVGTVTEVYDYLRLLFARIGHPHCPICGREIASQSPDQITTAILENLKVNKKIAGVQRFFIMSPVVKDRKGEFSTLFDNLKSKGYTKIRLDGEVRDLNEDMVLLKTNKHTIDAIVDRLSVESSVFKEEDKVSILRNRIAEAVEKAIKLSDGFVLVGKILDSGFEMPDKPKGIEDQLFSERFACPVDNLSLPEIEPRTFSFNSPHGACPKCTGLGKILTVNPEIIFADDLTIKEGGIVPFASIFEHDTWFSRLLLVFCEENKINIHTPIKTLPQEAKKFLLEGTGLREYRVNGKNRMGFETSILETFPGIIRELTKRHSEAESDYVRISIERYMQEAPCPQCLGARLKEEALAITIDKQSISEIAGLSIIDLKKWIDSLSERKVLSPREIEIGTLILKEIIARINFLINVGLDYLTLSRTAGTLAGGEAQRIRLASQIGSGLTGVLYVLDEPTIGLHPRDNLRLIATLKTLRDLGNSVVVVEHDREIMESSDYIVDFGPSAGKHGGVVIAKGSYSEILKDPNSITGKYLSNKNKIFLPSQKSKVKSQNFLTLFGASEYNLKNIDLKIPLGKFISITGVSGSGKSTLIVDTLYHAVAQKLNNYYKQTPYAFKRLDGVENIDKAILIDQSPIGRTPRSNPATYTKTFDLIREVYSQTREARLAGFKQGRFSFNVKGGRCEACEGQGQTRIEMQFMPDIWVNCEVCKGSRYNSQTLEITYKGKNIADVLAMTIAEAKEFFHIYTHIVEKLETLEAVGLSYMELGQSATTLSGGEAQRVKLSTELSRRATGKTLYILDEPTTGLHFADLEKLLAVLKILVSRGNSVIVIEHNLDIIKNSDWIIDLGPEGGEGGGYIVAQGSPEEVAKVEGSHTGEFLKNLVSRR